MRSRRVLFALLAVFAALGFVASFAVSGVSASGTTGTGPPDPDPPPITTHVVPPPPPPPPPAYTPPPPPPPNKRVGKAKPKPQRAEKKDAAVAPVTSTFTPRGPDGPAASAGLALVPTSQGSGGGTSDLLRLLLIAGLVLSVLLLGMAATPPWALPRHMGAVVYDHREALLTGGLVTAAGITVGLAITLLGS